MTRILLASVALLGLGAFAQSPVVGPNAPGIGDTPEARQVSEEAGKHPNATNSVAFSRTYNNAAETWNWRINITEFPVPNNIHDLGEPSANFSQGLRVTNIQWQLGWPGSGNQSLQSFLTDRNTTMHAHALIVNKPSNITSRYSDTDNGNCTNVLGAQCTQSLAEAAATGSGIDYLNLAGCSDVFSIAGGGIDDGTSYDIVPSESASNDTEEFPLYREDTLFYRTSQPYAAGNQTIFRESESALQLLILDFEDSSRQGGASSGPTVLCRIVDKTADTSAAIPWYSFPAAMWALVALVLVVSFQ